MPDPYYSDDLVTLYCGDSRRILTWRDADALVTDPPYGIAWRQGRLSAKGQVNDSHAGILNDADTSVRDDILSAWGDDRPSAVFGSLSLPPPPGTKQVLIYAKPSNAGVRGAMGGFRRDIEAVYLIGPWPSGIGGRSSILRTGARSQGNPFGVAAQGGHPHSKPLDVMAALLEAARSAGASVVADPFAGGGSTLVAARQLGMRAIGVELTPDYCAVAARRLSQGTFNLGALA